MNRIEEILKRIYDITGLSKDSQFCEKFNIKANTLSTWKKRNTVPYELIEQISQNENISFDYILNGNEENKKENKNNGTISIKKLSAKVQAGYNLTEIDSVEQIGELILDISIFKTPPPKKIFAMQVEGYSMIPMIFPDSWVVFDDGKVFKGDGLYIINWDGSLMVKLVQATPRNGIVKIISSNKDYESWEIDLNDNQCSFNIFGKVIKTII